MSKDARNDKVFTYFGFNLCNVLGAKNDTVMHLLTLESIYSNVKNDNVFTYSRFNLCNVLYPNNDFGVNLCNVFWCKE